MMGNVRPSGQYCSLLWIIALVLLCMDIRTATGTAGITTSTTKHNSATLSSTATGKTTRSKKTKKVNPYQVFIDTLTLNKDMIEEKINPLYQALLPYLNSDIGANPIVQNLANNFLILTLDKLPKEMKKGSFEEIANSFLAELQKVSVTGVDYNNARQIAKAVGLQFRWSEFLDSFYKISDKYHLKPIQPSIRYTAETLLLNFTLGTLPAILKNPLLWDVRDLLLQQVYSVNYTGVDVGVVPYVEAIGSQVDWTVVLDGIYKKLESRKLIPEPPTLSYVVKTMLLNFTLDTLPLFLKNPLVQGVEGILMEQLFQLDFTKVDPNNLGQSLKILSRQIHPTDILAKINALPAMQRASKDFPIINEKCSADTGYFIANLFSGKSWALTMLDAIGKPVAGITKGNLYMIGNYDQCLATVATDGNDTERFRGEYCRVTFNLPKSFIDSLGVDTRGIPIRLSWGLCAPSTCSSEDLKGVLTAGIMSRFHLDIREVYCGSSPQLKDDASAAVAIAILCFLIFMIVAGTLVDAIYGREKGFNQHSNDHMMKGIETVRQSTRAYIAEPEKSTYELKATNSNAMNGTAIEDISTKESGLKSKLPKKESLSARIWISFSVLSNAPKLLAASQAKGSITCLNGIRYISMAWIILCHTYYFGVFSISDNQTTANMIDAPTVMQRGTFMPVVYGTLAVDTFFLLSGFLVAYLFFKDLQKRKGQINCMKMVVFYVHRFWRLTPIYMIILMAFSCLYKYLGSGPLFPRMVQDADNCKVNWWTNLLYVNNLVRVDDMCMGWSWYLSDDMQFYIMSPVFILSLYFFPIIGIILTSLLIGASIVSTALIENRGAGNILSLRAPESGHPSYYDDIYIKPWCRVSTYAIGLLLAYAIFRRGQKTINIVASVIGWCFALAGGLFVVYCSHTEMKKDAKPWSQSIRTAYECLSRPVFGAAVAWVIFACHNGRGGVINIILSWKALIPMARLTYAAYLIHPILMVLYMYSRRTLIYLDDYSMVYFYLGHLCLAYAGAFILSVLFESPFLGLEKIVLKALGK